MGFAVDNGLTTASRVADPPVEQKRNAIAHETGVDVTGARAGDESGKRELFSESTETVLVFENGGVIRLAAEVAAGQLLFLTNRETKREVVAQITRIRPFPTGSPYIELEFTEGAPGFWGEEIPAAPKRKDGRATPASTLVPTPALEAALLQIVEEVREEPAVVTAAPNTEEMARLRREVEALREQLQSLKRDASAQVVAAPEAVVAEAPVAVRPELRRMRLPSADAPPPVREEAHELSADTAKGEKTVKPSDSAASEFSAEGLFPEVALDFTQADEAIERGALKNQKTRGASAGRNLRLVLLGASLVAAIAGGAWYEGWLPIGARFASATPTMATTRRVKGAPAAKNVGQKIAATSPLEPKSTPLASAAVAAPAAGGTEMPDSAAPAGEAKPVAEAAAELASTAEDARPEAAEKVASSKPDVKHGNERGAKAAEPTAVSMATESGATAPPKLIESVKAIPPRGFVTGNVVMDAVVDASGHVKSMKVLSGPESLRSAAIDALKKYKYEPALQNGKAVQGHVQETVKFWYEP